MFSSHFRLTDEEFKALWGECLFAVDANVILHLYRYSSNTRQALERSLESIADQLFLPHQAAREFFSHRLNVTAGQAEEYTKAITKLKEITAILTDTRKHPFLAGEELQSLSELSPKLISQLEFQRDGLLARLSNDEILDFVANVFNEKVGNSLSTGDLDLIIKEGDLRYEREIPPGYKDGKKQSTVDPYRKFGDLIIWRQLIQKSKTSSRPIIFITDDRKEDWWLDVSADVILTHRVGVNLTHLGNDGGLLAADNVDSGASSGDQGNGASRRQHSGDGQAAGLLTQHDQAVSA